MRLRNTETGRYVHNWEVVGQRLDERGYREVAICSHCGKIWAYGAGADRTYGSEEAARKAGEPLTIQTAEERMARAMRYDPEYQERTGFARNH